MATLRGSWRTPEHGSLSRSMSARNGLGHSQLDSVVGRGDYYRPSANTGEKRHLEDDLGSVRSRYSYSSQVRLGTSGGQTRTTCNIASIPRQDFFKPGTIIPADHFEEAYDNASIAANDKSIIHIPGQKPICRKARPFIVLAGHAQNYICLPIFSHNGNGTSKKPNPEEYVSLRDHRATIRAPQQSIHKPLITLDMSGPEITPASVAHLAYPVSRRYNIPVTIIGRLTSASTIHLIRLFAKYMPVQISEASPASSSGILIHAGMSIYKALTELLLPEYAHLFLNVSWSKAACLRDSDLEARGISSLIDRQQVLSLFDKVYNASRSRSDWTIIISRANLTGN